MNHPRIKVVLLAGGSGERFWPRSRPHLPKQFLDLDGTGSMLRKTYGRALGLVDPPDIFVATQAAYAELVRHHLPDLPQENLILEPIGRDTAPSLGLAALLLARMDPEAIMVVLPADHLITEEARFLQTLRAAAGAAEKFEALITLGVHPTRPETGYGYIQVGEVIGQCSGLPVHRVGQFVEKPDAATARKFLSSGDHLWNSGMFVWKVRVLLEEIKRHIPELASILADLHSLPDRRAIEETLPALYVRAPRVSIDYGVLEKSDRVLVVPAYFGWDDVGTWAALERLRPVDGDGNSISGPVVLYEARNVLVEAGSSRVVAVVGASDLIVVDSDDALLVCNKQYAHAVKCVVKQAESLVRSHVTPWRGARQDQVSERPWGQEFCWVSTGHLSGKFLAVRAGKKVWLPTLQGAEGALYVERGKGRVCLSGQWEDIGEGSVLRFTDRMSCMLLALSDMNLVEVAASRRD